MEEQKKESLLTVGTLTLDVERRIVRGPQGEQCLTDKEWRLYHYLVQHRDRVVSREELLKYMYQERRLPATDCLKVFVSKVRAKIAKINDGNHYLERCAQKHYTLNFSV